MLKHFAILNRVLEILLLRDVVTFNWNNFFPLLETVDKRVADTATFQIFTHKPFLELTEHESFPAF